MEAPRTAASEEDSSKFVFVYRPIQERMNDIWDFT